MKRFFAFVLVLVLAISLCACDMGFPETFETPDGATVRVDSIEENETVVFEHEAEWTVTKLKENVYYRGTSSTGHAYTTHSVVLVCEEYSCYVDINEEYYTRLTEGETVTATYSELFLGTHITKDTLTFKNGKTFSATCYKNEKIGEE